MIVLLSSAFLLLFSFFLAYFRRFAASSAAAVFSILLSINRIGSLVAEDSCTRFRLSLSRTDFTESTFADLRPSCEL